ncbi:hypothetical protein CYLTODRAFT_416854 [Cylindrobasidium torrendii FP15055 ss-10]|uniref:Copper homeostasis protein cutC homolog n=1 Tax=Cylindrobasidium torrendii FP15055 ss-10 TaxID=1314674 RepID=A0A0D7BV31_9AGAR|nr:hypothetical protein CYLTODRAFT_416854 [Cylindrobasidium torrendii FP15055 ss-10]
MASTSKSKSPLRIEVCVDSVQSAINAVNGGADRLELCATLANGGTTPSLGLFKAVSRAVPDVPIMVMIRPRAGDFVYNELELGVMLDDIKSFKNRGAYGVVFGVLTPQGQVDKEATKLLVDFSLPMQVSFHRAFDATRDPFEALEDIISIGGVSRILTSGHAKNVVDGLDMIVMLQIKALQLASSSFSILPGSGVNSDTIDTILVKLLPEGVREFHMSGGRWKSGRMAHRAQTLGFGATSEHEWDVWETDYHAVKEVRTIINMVCDKFGFE